MLLCRIIVYSVDVKEDGWGSLSECSFLYSSLNHLLVTLYTTVGIITNARQIYFDELYSSVSDI